MLEEFTGFLRTRPEVESAMVTTAEDGRPVAYVVLAGTAPSGGAGPDTQVESWRWVFEDCYDLADADECAWTAAITGWTDSFTGGPIDADGMAEWVDTTVVRIAQLAPRRVIEIGAGTGLLVRPLVERLQVEEYTATDFSERSVAILRRLAGQLRQGRPGIRMAVHRAAADEPVPPPADGGRYDTAVINSVAQYFPSAGYLESVLAGLLPQMAPGGHIFLGDLRNSRLLEQFAWMKHDALGTAHRLSERQIRDGVARELTGDGELSLDPDYVLGLARLFPQVSCVEAAPRRGAAPTEMTIFRYDAVLHLGCPPGDHDVPWEDGGSMTLTGIGHRLDADPAPFGLQGIPNGRLDQARRVRARYAEVEPAPGPPGIDPEALCRLGERHGRRVRLRWSRHGRPGDYDACFGPGDGPELEHYGISLPGTGTDLGAPGRVPYPLFPPGAEHGRRAALSAALCAAFPDAERPEIVFVPSLERWAGVAEPKGPMVADEDATRYQVVLNGEGQYSVWSADRELPAGWSAEGTVGGLEECTDRIDRIWTDLRPLSLVRLDAGPRSERTQ
ncbi:uncharacterized protein YbdZ (MbtH family) [Kitasatospora sp. GP82]|nr:uncharacterized protein YbdZ (MbtH family) [Kitasatospora sp. GP82]